MAVPPTTVVEAVLLSERDGRLCYRDVRAPLADGVHPDDLARRLAGLTPCVPGALLHSTSWRLDRGAVVLTYAALPDLAPDAGVRAVQVDAVSGGGHPLTPSPHTVDLDAVAAHACRHLALLAATDEAVGGAARLLPQLWELLRKLPPSPAGALSPAGL
ncbi:hypothetical protein Cs7R123_52000 [Catellatospora sp. TT07R-123]|uniref:hypothetical protein n=1 Tax=Catellatospora sp. TT07R-123 TaxID=2733863 RepID=UPI001B2CE11C|nr:hypothetical protein [Catellatospora sp. TT07R-123]GHJ47858.1 hypothetical protein Cs7R123_52000 [Catellatospora sp. TT07R-123]